MNGTRRLAVVVLIALVGCCVAGGFLSTAQAQDTGTKPPPYTMAEYNSYTAACNEKNPAQQIRLLDDFVQKYPTSALLVYIYQCYYQNYNAQKNFPKVIEYADKLVALGDKVDAAVVLQALYLRSVAYYSTFNEKHPDARALAEKARAQAQLGLKSLADMKPPQGTTEEQWAQTKKQLLPLFNTVVGMASGVLKDYPTAVTSYKAALADAPNDAVLYFRLGVAYLSMSPPQHLDGFWALARSVSLKGQTEAQVRKYLRNQMLNYQQPACENLLDAELNELITLAGSAAERPDSYKLPSSADLDAARKEMNIASVITDLKAGADKGKTTWLASCGLEFPDVPGKLIELTPGADSVGLKLAFFSSEAEFDAATTPNMDVKVVGQPEAARLEKGNPVRFTGTLVSYDPDPAFMLHWDKAKVNKEDIPEEKKKAPAKRPARRPAPKKRPG